MLKSTIAKNIFKLSIIGFIGLVVFVFIFYFGPIYPPFKQPKQPIAYSHKVHAGELGIDCQYCHSYARRSEMAGVPAVSVCMNCHARMLKNVNTPEVLKLKEYFDNGRPIQWIRINDLPDHVWFSHKRHIAKDVPCQKCHGSVETMEVVRATNHFQMGFCLDCHQENNAPTDCLICHT